MKPMLSNMIFSIVLLHSIGIGQAVAFAQGPRIHGTVVDSSTNPPKTIAGIAVLVYELDAKSTHNGPLIVDFDKSILKTGNDGVFSINCSKAADRIVVWFVDTMSTTRGFTYETIAVLPFSGRQEMVLNPAILPQKNRPVAVTRSILNVLKGLIPHLGQEERSWVEDYLVSVVSDGISSDPNFRLGEELASVDRLMRPPVAEVSITPGSPGSFWVMDVGKEIITKWELPGDFSEPTEVSDSRSTLQYNKSNSADFQNCYVAASDLGFQILENRKTGGRERYYQGLVDDENSEIVWAQLRSRTDVTSASGNSTQKILVLGSSDGEVVLEDPKQPDSANFEVGRTPVVATALSPDGTTFAGATIDGAYRVWKLNATGNLADAETVISGQLPKSFPAAMSFSPDGKSLVVGTGIGKREGAVVAIDLTPGNMGKFLVSEYPAAISKIMFSGNSGDLLATSVDGKTLVFKLMSNDSGLQVIERFGLTGIRTFELLNDENAAVLKVDEKSGPVVLTLADMFDEDTFETHSHGIKVESSRKTPLRIPDQ